MPISSRIEGRPKARINQARMRKTAKTILSALGSDAGLSILFTDDAVIHDLNRRWLKRDRPTDVISWAADESGFLGDLAISIDTAARQAREIGHPLDDELARLLIHGILHLLGHDHVRGGRQARRMRAEEDRLVALLAGAHP